MKKSLPLLLGILVFVWVAGAYAQRPDFGRREGGDRGPGVPGFGGPGGPGFGGPGGPGGPSGRGGSPEERIQRMEGFLKSFDTNGDGIITPEELGPRKEIFDRIVGRYGMTVNGPVSIASIKESALKYYQQQPSPGGPPGGPSGPSPTPAPAGSPTGPAGPTVGFKPSPNPSIAGFGGPSVKGGPSPMGFGSAAPAPAATPSSPPPASTPNSATPSASDKERVRTMAESIIRQYDKNKNGQIDKDEQAEMRGPLRDADANRDGIITRDELEAKLMEFAQRRGDKGRSEQSPGGTRSSVSGQNGRRSYKAPSGLERVRSKNLPSWFYDKDADEDGQISMKEFAGFWTDEEAAKFAKWDLNNDGFITPDEVLAVLKKDGLAKK